MIAKFVNGISAHVQNAPLGQMRISAWRTESLAAITFRDNRGVKQFALVTTDELPALLSSLKALPSPEPVKESEVN